MWKKLIKRGEKVGLELTRAERKSLLTGPRPPPQGGRRGDPIHAARRASHDHPRRSGRHGGSRRRGSEPRQDRGPRKSGPIYGKIEELLGRTPKNRVRRKEAPDTIIGTLIDIIGGEKPTILPMPSKPGTGGEQYPVKLTGSSGRP